MLWLWCRLTAAALMRPLAWEPPYAKSEALKKKQKKKKRIFHDIGKIYEIQNSASINNVLLEKGHAHLCTVCACFYAETEKLKNCDETIGLQNLEYLLSSFIGKVCQSLVYYIEINELHSLHYMTSSWLYN